MIAVLGLVVGIVLGPLLQPAVPSGCSRTCRSRSSPRWTRCSVRSARRSTASSTTRSSWCRSSPTSLVAALIVFLGDQLGVGSQLSTGVVVVLSRPDLRQRRRDPPAAVPRMSTSRRPSPAEPGGAPARRCGAAVRPRAPAPRRWSSCCSCCWASPRRSRSARTAQVDGLSTAREADLVRHPRRPRPARNADWRPSSATCRRPTTSSASGTGRTHDRAGRGAQARPPTLGILAGTVPATGPGIDAARSPTRRARSTRPACSTPCRSCATRAPRPCRSATVRVVAARPRSSTAGPARSSSTARPLRAAVHAPCDRRPAHDGRRAAASPAASSRACAERAASASVAERDRASTVSALHRASTPQYARPALDPAGRSGCATRPEGAP